MNDPFAVDLDGCRSRQTRLLAELEKHGLPLALLTRPESVQWLTGAWVPPPFSSVASISIDGEVKLVVPQHLVDIPFGADCVLPYEAQRLATLIDDQQRSSFEAFAPIMEHHTLTNRRRVFTARASNHSNLAGRLD